MTTAKQPHDSRSVDSEQWSVVAPAPELGMQVNHRWRLVRLENSLGRKRPGLQCIECGDIQVLSERDFNSYGRGPVGERR